MNVFKSIVTNVKRHLITLGVVVTVIVGIGIAVVWWPKASGEAAISSEVWTCSMHPQVRLPRPGSCPICGMKLIPTSKLTAKKGDERQYASLETQAITRRELFKEIQTVGKIDYNESHVEFISARIAGRVDRLYVDFTGIEVKENDHLLDLYSPQLISAQAELIGALEASESSSSGNSRLSNRFNEANLLASREKLRLWGLLPEQIAEIERTRKEQTHITIYAPLAGTVIEKNVRLGQYIKEGDQLYRIAELDPIWLYLDLYEYDIAAVRYGQRVDVELEAFPGEVFRGIVTFIDPFLEERTRTIKVRVNLKNPERKLKAGMYASATIRVRLLGNGAAAPTGLEGKFSCPMHPEVIQEKPGKCPVCKMDLILIPEGSAFADFRGHAHAEHVNDVDAALPSEHAAEPTMKEKMMTDADMKKMTAADVTAAATTVNPLAIPASAVLDTGRRQITYRSTKDDDHLGHLELLEEWLKSYRPEELFDDRGRLLKELAELAPVGERRMGANPHANGGLLLIDLVLPDFRKHAVEVPAPGTVKAADTHVLGEFFRDVAKLNRKHRNFRIFGPDETLSNRLNAVFEVTNRQWDARTQDNDAFLDSDGRVMEMLSEHQCEGWLEGYLLTGRHGLFNSYEAFIHIIDSMFNQHAKWLKVTSGIPWRKKIASLNYLLASHVWQQAHNGFTHQDPGFIDHVVNKKASIVRVYLPPDANCLLSVWDHCLRSRHYVNVVIAGKYKAPQWLSMDEAVKHCTAGIGKWHWASNDGDAEPDVVMACCGDVPTLETLAAVSILREHLPDLKVRVVNVVDLMKLQPASEHPHGLSDEHFDALFTRDKPIIFAFHGYPSLVHQLTYRRTNHDNLHVRGYKEEGTITTTFDMTVLNELDRYHLVMDTIDRLPQNGDDGARLKQQLTDKLQEHFVYIRKHGLDMPEIRNWKWIN